MGRLAGLDTARAGVRLCGRRVPTWAVGAACVLAGLVAAPRRRARASSVRNTTLEQLAIESSLVVTGYVEDTDTVDHGPHGLPGIHTRVTLQVDDLVAGNSGSDVTFWVHGGALGNRMRRVIGQATFKKGEAVATFLFDNGVGDLWPTEMARGKWRLLPGDPDTYVAPTVPLDGDPLARGPPTTAPADRYRLLVAAPWSGGQPSPDHPIPLTDFKARVRAARGGR